MRKVWLAGSTALLTLLLAACTGEDTGSPETDGPSSAPSAADAGDASARLAAAVDAVLTSGHYDQSVTTPGLDDPYYEVTGAYDVAARRFSAVMAFWNPEAGETRRIEHRFLDGRGFQQARAWTGRKSDCWLLIDAPGSGRGRQPGGLAAADAPAAVRALATVDSVAPLPSGTGQVVASIDLRVARALLPGYLRIRMPQPTGTVPAVFSLDDDGGLVGWQVAGRDLVDALQKSGADLTDDLVSGISTFTLGVEYDGIGEPVDVAAPARELWMSPADLRAHRGCSGG